MAVIQYLGGWFVLKGSHWVKISQEYLLALSAGFLIALVLVTILPESVQLSEFSPLYMIIGFGALHFFEHSIIGHMHFGEETHHHHVHQLHVAVPTFVGLFIHAVFDGIAVSAVYLHNASMGFLMFIGLILHKFPEGFTVATVTKAADWKQSNSHKAVIGLALGSLIGVLIIFLFEQISSELSAVFLGFAGGITLYIAASDLIPEINKSEKRYVPLTVFAGMLLYWAVSVIFHPTH